MPDRATKKRRKKPGFFKRMANRGREFLRLGRILVNEPRSFPRELLALLRRSVRTVWDARGGGFYACGFVLTFFWLEARMFVDDIRAADGVGEYLGAQLFEKLFRYFGESIGNVVQAFIWPLFLIDSARGIATLVGLYLVFATLVKKPLERWLFGDPPTTES